MKVFVRASDRNKFISNSHQHTVPVGQHSLKLSDKCVLKTKLKIEKTTFKIVRNQNSKQFYSLTLNLVFWSPVQCF